MKKSKKAFTLVELLVVIAILAILATVSILGYTSFTKKAKQSNCQSELTQIKDYILAEVLDGGTFEVSNTSTDYVELTSAPADWSTNYTSYFTKSSDTYSSVSSGSAPDFSTGTYYRKKVVGVKFSYDSAKNLVKWEKLGDGLPTAEEFQKDLKEVSADFAFATGRVISVTDDAITLQYGSETTPAAEWKKATGEIETK